MTKESGSYFGINFNMIALTAVSLIVKAHAMGQEVVEQAIADAKDMISSGDAADMAKTIYDYISTSEAPTISTAEFLNVMGAVKEGVKKDFLRIIDVDTRPPSTTSTTTAPTSQSTPLPTPPTVPPTTTPLATTLAAITNATFTPTSAPNASTTQGPLIIGGGGEWDKRWLLMLLIPLAICTACAIRQCCVTNRRTMVANGVPAYNTHAAEAANPFAGYGVTFRGHQNGDHTVVNMGGGNGDANPNITELPGYVAEGTVPNGVPIGFPSGPGPHVATADGRELPGASPSPQGGQKFTGTYQVKGGSGSTRV